MNLSTLKPKTKEVLIWPLLAAAYLGSRLVNLTILPAFLDEASHLDWARKFAATGQFSTLIAVTEVGKIFSIWLTSLLLPISPDLLWVGRFVSVIAGAFAVVGCFLVGRRLYDSRVGFLSALLYIITPFTLFHDRMALVDNVLTACVIYVFFFSLLAVQQGRWWQVLLLGASLALTGMTKLNGVIFFALPVIVIIAYRHCLKDKKCLARTALAGAIGSLGVIPSLMNLPHQSEDALNKTWLDKFNLNMLGTLAPNMALMLYFLVVNLTWPVFLLACLAILSALIRREKEGALLLAASLVPILFFALTSGDNWFPRYILPSAPFLLLLAARAIGQITERAGSWPMPGGPLRRLFIPLLLLVAALPALSFDYWLIFNPQRAPFAQVDRWQYLEGWVAGYGYPEAAKFIIEQSEGRGTCIVVQNTEGTQPTEMLKVYLPTGGNLSFSDLNLPEMPPDYIAASLLELHGETIYLVTYQSDLESLPVNPGQLPGARIVAEFPRPDGNRIEIYQISNTP
jgi:4-amino-4-deoxy-L-arabinose transferase-like glycosyltransferase